MSKLRIEFSREDGTMIFELLSVAFSAVALAVSVYAVRQTNLLKRSQDVREIGFLSNEVLALVGSLDDLRKSVKVLVDARFSLNGMVQSGAKTLSDASFQQTEIAIGDLVEKARILTSDAEQLTGQAADRRSVDLQALKLKALGIEKDLEEQGRTARSGIDRDNELRRDFAAKVKKQ